MKWQLKYLLLASILSLTGHVYLNAQPCLPNGIAFNTQEQVDSFPILYPNCSEIEGYVEIRWSNISDLSPLGSIQYINGNLKIYGNDSLVNLSGLDSLRSIGGDLVIGHHSDFSQYGNKNLVNLEGLGRLETIGGSLMVYHNIGMIDFSGINQLDTILGEVKVFNNDNLLSIMGLETLDYIGSTLSIHKNDVLSTCHAQGICDYLSMPNGSVNIHSNAEGCNTPIEVSQACSISIPCLPMGNYYFMSQSEIDSFQVFFPDCIYLKGNVTVEGEDVVSLDGLSQVKSISGEFKVKHNENLQSLSGLSNLDSVGSLRIDGNNALASLSGLDGLHHISLNCKIVWNEALLDLAGLTYIDSLGGTLWISSNPNLESLNDLTNLISIGGNLSIDYNGIRDLHGLGNLREINGLLMIVGNQMLNSLSGIDSISSSTIADLILIENPQLSECDINSICNYILDPNNNAWIDENSVGCNSLQEVEQACTVGVSDKETDLQLSAFPNPFTSSTTIEYELTEPTHVQLTIYNAIGEMLYEAEEGIKQHGRHTITWSAESLPEGLYYAVLRSGEGVSVVKMLKQ